MVTFNPKYKDFADRLQQSLGAQGKTQKKLQTGLAKAVGVSQPSARKWILGEAMPDDENLKKLAAYLKVSFQWLKYGDEFEGKPIQELTFVIGDELSPIYPAGAIAIYDISIYPATNHYVLFTPKHTEHITAAQFMHHAGEWLLVFENKKYSPLKYNAEKIKIIGVITEIRINLIPN